MKELFFSSIGIIGFSSVGRRGSGNYKNWSLVILVLDFGKGRVGREGVYWFKKLKYLLELLIVFWLSLVVGYFVVDRFFF